MKNNGLTINEKIKIPGKFKKYFWDCNFNKITWDAYSFFITERILQFGNSESIEWLLKKIDTNYLKSVLKKSRILDKKTINFWEIMLNEKFDAKSKK